MLNNVIKLKINTFSKVLSILKGQKKQEFHTQTPKLKSFRNWYRDLWSPKSVKPPYFHIIQIGDPVLRRKAELVPHDCIESKEVQTIIEQMIYVLRKFDCVGLAAPQIGIPLRIIIMEFKENLKKEFPLAVYKLKNMETLPLTVVINPSIKVLNYNQKTFLESCASVRGYAGEVCRYEEIELKGFTHQNKEIKLNLKGWNARIAQHELDHLDGTIYTDKMDPKTFQCTCWHQVNIKGGRIEIPFYPK